MIDVADLRDALKGDELIPFFQPIVELRTGRLSGFEVLTRWAHPIVGAYLPINLIELAEQQGLISEVSRQVFTKAFRHFREVPESLRLSVNVSPLQVACVELTRQLQTMSAETGFPLSRLTVEITESALLSDLSRSLEVVESLKALGCRLSLDDFGTGFSSLLHLQALPFDELKVDRSFVARMTNKRESRKIVAAIVGLGHSLGLSTVAEGIETGEQAEMLLRLGSEFGQGWHYGRPAPFESIRRLLTEPVHEIARGELPVAEGAVSSLEALPVLRLAQLQAIYDGAPVGLCFVDRNLRYISINERLARMNGASVAAHLGRGIPEMVPEVYRMAEPFLQRALAGEAITGVEIPHSTPGGGPRRWVLASYQPVFDEANEVIGVSISVSDITELKHTRDELKEREIWQWQLAQLNRLAPWSMDAAGNDLQVGAGWMRSVPGSAGKPRKLGWLKALHIEDRKPTLRKVRQALRTGEQIDVEYRILGAEGEWRWVRSRGLPRLGPNDEILCWYGTVEDIHDRKRAEFEARNAELAIRALLTALPVASVAKTGKARRKPALDEVPGGRVQAAYGLSSAALSELALIPAAAPGRHGPVPVLAECLHAEPAGKPEAKRKKGGARVKPKVRQVEAALTLVEDVESASVNRHGMIATLDEPSASQQD
jgi:PAS domain S-box-containing protein